MKIKIKKGNPLYERLNKVKRAKMLEVEEIYVILYA